MLKVFETRREVIRAHLKELAAQIAASPDDYNLLLERFSHENYLTLYTEGVGMQSDDDEAVESWLNDFGAACVERYNHYSNASDDVRDIGAALAARDLKNEVNYALWLLACPRRDRIVAELQGERPSC